VTVRGILEGEKLADCWLLPKIKGDRMVLPIYEQVVTWYLVLIEKLTVQIWKSVSICE